MPHLNAAVNSEGYRRIKDSSQALAKLKELKNASEVDKREAARMINQAARDITRSFKLRVDGINGSNMTVDGRISAFEANFGHTPNLVPGERGSRLKVDSNGLGAAVALNAIFFKAGLRTRTIKIGDHYAAVVIFKNRSYVLDSHFMEREQAITVGDYLRELQAACKNESHPLYETVKDVLPKKPAAERVRAELKTLPGPVSTLAKAYHNTALQIEAEYPGEAHNTLVQAAGINSKDPEIHFDLGRLNLKFGNYELAKEHLQKALELDRDHQQASDLLKKIEAR